MPVPGQLRKMDWGLRQNVNKSVILLIELTLLLGVSACSGVITIERIPTPEPTPVALSQEELVADRPVSVPGVPKRIVAEEIGLDAPVVEMGWRVEEEQGQAVSVWEIPVNEAGWHRNSARPGEEGNVVISGHNNSTGGHVFGTLEELEVGDQITLLTDKDESYVYQVSEKEIVRAFAASQETLDYLQAVIRPTPVAQLTLITCWPNWTNTHRLIIVAHPL